MKHPMFVSVATYRTRDGNAYRRVLGTRDTVDDPKSWDGYVLKHNKWVRCVDSESNTVYVRTKHITARMYTTEDAKDWEGWFGDE